MATTAAAPPRNLSYMLALLFVLTLGNGVVGFDRSTVSYLAPFIVRDMGLNNTQIGWIASALSLAIALSSFFGSQIADSTGRRKQMLIVCTLVFSVLSGAGGLALTFGFLLATRFALGLAEGPIVPMSQTLILNNSSPKWRGFNMGFMQMVGAFGIAGFFGPIAATWVGAHYGWRTAMYLSIVPGLLVAALMVFMLRPDDRAPPADRARAGSPIAAFVTLLSNRNMLVILAVAGLFTAWLVLQASFMILFLTRMKGIDPETAGWVAAMGGPGALAGGILLPWLSDRVGRKPVLVVGALAGIVGPIALIVLPGQEVPLAIAVLVGWFALGIGPLYCATVPTESVSPALATTAVGLSMGFAELFGGVVVPPVAGRAADLFSLDAIFWICAGLALATALVALLLKETAPCKFALSEED